MALAIVLSGCATGSAQRRLTEPSSRPPASAPATAPTPRAVSASTLVAATVLAAQVVGSTVVPPTAEPTTAAPPAQPAQQPDLVHATHQPVPVPGRLVLLGDSIADQLCTDFPEATCEAFPGGWVADANGADLADRFVTEAELRPADTVVLSSIGGWHSPGVDDGEILRRLQALYERVAPSVRRLIVLVPPYPNFILCTAPTTPEAMALLGSRHDELCHTQQLIADLERTWSVTEVPIIGPYVSDQEHETPEARRQLAAAIRFVLAAGPADISS